MTRYELGALEEDERKAFVGHLIQCEYCHNEVYSMAPFMSVLREHREAVLRGEIPAGHAPVGAVIGQPAIRPFWQRRWALATAATLLVAVGAGLLTFLLMREPSAPQVAGPPEQPSSALEVATVRPPAWPDLVIPKAPYTRPGEQPALRSVEPTAFERAMVAYEKNDFATAAEQLESVTRLEPDHAEAFFYRGVSLLLLDKSQDAIAPLKEAIQLSAGPQHESGHYYLALAYLKTNQLREAVAELDEVIKMRGRLRREAIRLRREVIAQIGR